jgi:hypothetical protein
LRCRGRIAPDRRAGAVDGESSLDRQVIRHGGQLL